MWYVLFRLMSTSGNFYMCILSKNESNYEFNMFNLILLILLLIVLQLW